MVRVGMQWESTDRGSIEVFLTSPSGQRADLLKPRPRDHYSGRAEMVWKSLLHTGESCYGNWTVTVSKVFVKLQNGKRIKKSPVSYRKVFVHK